MIKLEVKLFSRSKRLTIIASEMVIKDNDVGCSIRVDGETYSLENSYDEVIEMIENQKHKNTIF